MNNTVSWFEIYVDDMDRARAFYESMLDVELESLEGGGPEFLAFPHSPDAYGAGGALAKVEGVDAGGNSTLVYFHCEDCGVTGQRAVAAGGGLVKDKFSIGEYGFIVLATDTEGNMIGLHSPK